MSKPFYAATLVFAAAMITLACGSEAAEPTAPDESSSTVMTAASAGASGSRTVTAQSAGGSATAPPKASATAGTSVPATAGANAAGSGADAATGGSSARDEDAGAPDAPTTPTMREPLSGRMYTITHELVSDAPTFNITRPADLNVTGGLLPVVVWANGGCLRSDFSWAPLFDHWARSGFVVLSLTGTGGPDDLAGMLSSTTKAEHGALIDWVVKANASGPLEGALDIEHIVAAGNSCGGVTALELTAEDKRVAAVFVLSGSSAVGSVNTEVMKAVSVPVGYITGSESEDVAAPNASDDYDAMEEGIPAMLMQRTTGDHITVSTDAMILPQNAEIALSWMDLALYGTKQALDTLTATDKVCASCTPAVWKLKAKHLETLVK
ncbi:MAG TPA: hypothetical protein VMF89_09715 [Polyangiales bacterium]|nr:hypothetical protein [Polyangiales bacterium]